jgi:uncharacterized iron-regulated protein
MASMALRVACLVTLVAGCAAKGRPLAPEVRVLEQVSAEVSARRGPATVRRLVDDGTDATLVCLGEQHDEPLHQRLHAVLTEVWAERAAAAGLEVALGMEMFEAEVQPTLDAFAAGKLDWQALMVATDWESRWGYDADAYRPLIELGRDHGIRLVALNAPKEITGRVARGGIAALPPALLARLPEMVLDDEEHRRFFWATLEATASPHGRTFGPRPSPHAGADLDNLYAAQVIWDETMATNAAAWLAASPRRRMMVVAGNGHCHDSAIARRALRRLGGGGRAITVLTRARGEDLPPFASSDYIVTVGDERMAWRNETNNPRWSSTATKSSPRIAARDSTTSSATSSRPASRSKAAK